MIATTATTISEKSAEPHERALCETLVRSGRLAPATVARALRAQEDTSEALSFVLVRLGLLSENDLVETMSELSALHRVGRSDFPHAAIAVEGLSARFLRSIRVVPLSQSESALIVAIANPCDPFPLTALAFLAARPVTPLLATVSDIDWALDRLYRSHETASDSVREGLANADVTDVDRLRDLASEAPVIRLVSRLVAAGVERKASDVHFEASEDGLHVRYRMDGLLQPIEHLPNHLKSAVVSRLKVMASLNIAERRVAQDGRVRLAIKGRETDFRVSTVPTLHGESVVLRILDRHDVVLSLPSLGLEGRDLKALRTALARPHGIVLVTGPTGSGKTTTLYAALGELNRPERKILTVEDPVEYAIDGINQTAVKPQIGLTFASALRSFLRQDPDVMMVGEIRDAETAQIAVQAALTGHLVLSTLHTNNAAGAATRLLDMGVNDYLIASSLGLIIGQRLVRTLCPACRRPCEATDAMIEQLRLDPGSSVTLCEAAGCSACHDSGYAGRTAVIEVLTMSDTIRRLIMAHAPTREIEQAAVAEGMRTMFRHGAEKVARGVTTLEEVLRVTLDTGA